MANDAYLRDYASRWERELRLLNEQFLELTAPRAKAEISANARVRLAGDAAERGAEEDKTALPQKALRSQLSARHLAFPARS